MFVVLDLETTGLLPREDAIIELAFVKISRDTFQEIDRISTFINPQRPIPQLISQITNIYDEDIEEAPIFSKISDEIQDFIEWFPLIWHNVQFDIRFLEANGIDTSKNPIIDTFFFANFLCHSEKSLNLWYLCDVLGISLKNAHRAIDDTLATLQVFQKLMIRLQTLAEPQQKMVYHYFTKTQDVGVHIVRDEYLEKYTTSNEQILQDYENILHGNMYDIDDKNSSNSVENIMDFIDTIPDFELRENQKKMLDTVDTTLQKGGKIVIEAPTGIGKTFAYLLPAIKHSLLFWEAVHISTSTKALQDQIYYKDLAFLKKHFPQEFSFTKLKGKKNYLGVRSFIEFLETENYYTTNKSSFILKILFWSISTEFGELDELDFYGEEYSFVSEIHAGWWYIFDESNLYKDIEFALRARKRAKKSNIIITNNHILFQDIISEGSLLWGVKNLILDEAHSLEDIVTQSLKKNLSFQSLEKLFQKIEKRAKNKSVTFPSFSWKYQEILFDATELFSIFEWSLFQKFNMQAKYKSLLLSEKYFTEQEYIMPLVQRISENLEIIRQDILGMGEKKSLLFSAEVQEIQYFRELLREIFIDTDFTNFIYYISHNEQQGTMLHSTVLRPWKFLQEKLWNSLESVVLTSATLQMEDDFTYIKNMLELQDFETLLLPSDFNYEKQALLFIPQDLWNIKDNLSEIVCFLEKFFEKVRGRTLVLFTAFVVIREVFSQLKNKLQQKEIYLLAQSISGSKYKQIDFFRKNPNSSILLWTDTFWEGIDIPWEDLQYLIIHKIPFQVPSDPIFQARSRLFQNSFEQYAIPKATLKLKQWFGRLIRTKKDTGIVVFLDERVLNTSWGIKLLDAFPKDIKRRVWESQKLLDIL